MDKRISSAKKMRGSGYVVALWVLGAWGTGACGGLTSSKVEEQSTTSTNPPTPTTSPSVTTSTSATTTASAVPTTTGTTPAQPLPNGEYWMNFFPGKKSPVKVGNRFNLWIGFDLSQASKDYYPPDTFFHQGKVAPNVETYQALGTPCGGTVSEMSLITSKDVGPGQATWVDHVSVIYHNFEPVDPQYPPDLGDRMCFGYRIGSQWTWDPQRRKPTWQEKDSLYTADFPVQKEAVNAFLIVFEGTMARTLDRFIIATKPGP